MFTVSSPEYPKLIPLKARTLKTAIRFKVDRQNIYKGSLFVITDEDGYVVSTVEQRNYLRSLFF
jgi:hypothetical protein